MDTIGIVILVSVTLIFGAGLFFTRGKNNVDRKTDDVGRNTNDIDTVRVVSYKVVVPLRIQACERLLLYLERIKFPILVKRIYQPGLSRDDFQFTMIQNVQDEFEHNLAQRLYVAEDTWQLVNLAKEEVLQNVNAAFTSNPEADTATVATLLSSFENPIAEKAILNIKKEFDSFLV